MGDGRKKISPNTLHVLAFMEQLPSNEMTSLSSHFAKNTVRESCNLWAWWLLNFTSLLIPVPLFTQLNPHCEVATVRISSLIMAHFKTYIIFTAVTENASSSQEVFRYSKMERDSVIFQTRQPIYAYKCNLSTTDFSVPKKKYYPYQLLLCTERPKTFGIFNSKHSALH